MFRKLILFVSAMFVLIALSDAIPASRVAVADPKASPDLKTEESHGFGYGYPGYYGGYGLYGYGGHGGYGSYYPYYGYGHHGGYPYYGSYGYYW